MLVGYSAGYLHDGHVVSLCSLQDAKRQLAHERLAVGRAFASDDEVGIL